MKNLWRIEVIGPSFSISFNGFNVNGKYGIRLLVHFSTSTRTRAIYTIIMIIIIIIIIILIIIIITITIIIMIITQ